MLDAPEVKICGLRHGEDVQAADDLGATFVGVVVTRGFGRSVEPDVASKLVAGVRATVVAVLVDESPAVAATVARALGAGVVQLHGAESAASVRELAERGPWQLWKSVRAATLEDVQRAVDVYGPWVGGILVEGRREGVVGGGGAALDPEEFAGLRDAVPRSHRLILAGGLTPETVEGAMARWLPDVVDVSSGVEVAHGRKDRALMRRFIQAVRGGSSPGPSDPTHPYGAST